VSETLKNVFDSDEKEIISMSTSSPTQEVIPAPPTGMLIDGEFCGSVTGETFPVTNPARGTVLFEVPRSNAADVDRAVYAAQSAFEAWSRMPPRERGRLLTRIADDIERDTEPLSRLLAAETGNAIRTQSRPEVKGTAELFRYYGGLGTEIKGDTLPINRDMLNFTWREPMGVVAAITPWNAPLSLAAAKVAPALLCGNTVVLKTAEDAPLAVLMLAQLCARHLPRGVLNVLTGFGAEAGSALSNHPKVAKISFTGSTQIGRQIMRGASDRVVPVSLELGGKSPSIVFPDADTAWAADGVVAATRVTRQSQACVAGARIYIHESIFDSFVGKIVERLGSLRIGDPLDEATDIGSLINRKQFDRVCGYIRETMDLPGSRLLVGGMPESGGDLSNGFFAKPTVFADIDPDARVLREEVFGPVICVSRWTTEAEILAKANDTTFGLAAFLWSANVGAALRLARDVRAGFVQINQALGQFPGQSYGGMKESGIGREYSLDGMLESYTVVKNVAVGMRET
jgi:betaine-aldehyde dehydrogenase